MVALVVSRHSRAVFLLWLLAGCNSLGPVRPAPAETAGESLPIAQSTPVGDEATRDGWSWEKLTVNPVKTTAGTEYTYEFTKRDGKWVIVRGIEATAAFDDGAESFERIAFNPESLQLSLRYDKICTMGQFKSDSRCSCARGLISEASRKGGYTLCSSELKKAVVNPAFALTAGLAAFLTLGTSTSIVYEPDSAAILAVAREADLLKAASQDRRTRYAMDYQRARQSSNSLGSFVEMAKRSQYDPDNVLPEAERLLPELRGREDEEARKLAAQRELDAYRQTFKTAATASDWQGFVVKYANADPDNLLPSARKNMAAAKRVEIQAAAKVAVELKLAQLQAEKERKRQVAEESKARKLASAPISTDGSCRPRAMSIRCQSECINGDCIVSYENGCRIRVRVQPRYDPFDSRWTYPSPPC